MVGDEWVASEIGKKFFDIFQKFQIFCNYFYLCVFDVLAIG